MKIGIVCYPSVGGSGILATELGHQLASRGHEIHFITYEIPFRLRLSEKGIFFHEVAINQYDLFKYPDYALTLSVKIAQIAKEYDLDILHVHYAIPHATSAFLAKQLLGNRERPAIITTLHGTDITLVGKDPAYFDIVKFSIENSSGITAVSNHLRQETYDHFHVNRKIDVIYNFVIPRKKLFNCKTLKSSFVNEDEKLIIHASNFRPVKRVPDVVTIFSKIRKKIKSKLLFLGMGEGIQEVRQMVQELDLEDHVSFLGYVKDIDTYIACADLFLLPSAQESFGLAALEAMAYGIPVVATEAGGLPELISNGENGFLAPVGATEKMSEQAINLLTNQKLSNQISKAAQLTATKHFNANQIISQYEALYLKVLSPMASLS